MRRPITMDDGSAIIFSVAKYYGPDGKSIQDNAVTPEELVVEAEPTVVDPDSDEPQVADVDQKPSEDLILKKAIEVAQKKG